MREHGIDICGRPDTFPGMLDDALSSVGPKNS